MTESNQDYDTESSNSELRAELDRHRQLEDELRAAKETAEGASRAKSDFMANISHELRTPMNAILGMTELALQEPLSPPVRDYLKMVKDSADTMLFLVNDILDFSRLEAGRFELEPVSFSLRSLLDETMRTLALRAHEKGLELAYHVDRVVPESLVGDPMRLRQVVTNLAGNALKFTERGEVVIRVSLESSQQEITVGGPIRITLCVSDSGIGISKEDLERIFVPFAQADSSSTRRYSGTGLGLSICTELTELMDGTLRVESEPGKGSHFYVTVCLEVSDEEEEELPSLAFTPGSRVLVVDDNQTQREIIGELLRDLGFDPVVAADANGAMLALEDSVAFDLVIIDALMPGVDGFMLIEQARARSVLEAPVVLMVSPADRQIFSDRAETLDLAGYLDKPVSLYALHGVIREVSTPNDGGASSQSSAFPGPQQSLRVLVAEDTPANQKVLRAMLTRRGHSVKIAHNGREAIDRLQSDDFDLVLMDVQMPTMDGIQATVAIRESESDASNRLPIIAMTAHAMRGDREACLAAGMDHYVAKPINYTRLIRVVERFGLPSGKQRASEVRASPERTSGDSLTTDAVWDHEAALQRLGGDASLLDDLITYFLEDSPTLQDAIDAAIDQGNAQEIQRNAHALKGLCANFEATAAAAIALEIENLGGDGELDRSAYDLATLEAQVRKLAESLCLWRTAQSL